MGGNSTAGTFPSNAYTDQEHTQCNIKPSVLKVYITLQALPPWTVLLRSYTRQGYANSLVVTTLGLLAPSLISELVSKGGVQ